MGVFDWIGEAIGNAFSALAEFFGDTFGGLFKKIGGQFLTIGKENLTNIVTDAKDPKSTTKADMEALTGLIEAPIKEGFEHHLKEFSKKHSEIPVKEIDKAVSTLWTDVKGELALSAGIATIVEVASFGQIEGCQNIMKIADTTRGLSSFANEVSMIRLRAQYLNTYERLQNFRSPSKIPGPGDIVRFGLREVYDVDIRKELLVPRPGMDYYNQMLESGFNTYNADSFWAAHWVLPSLGNLDEMLHRGIIKLPEWKAMVRRNDYLPAWIDNREKIIYKPYTRVDIRRMKDLELVTDAEVLKNYGDLGYDEEHASRMTIWTKSYILSVEMRARYSKGWVTEDDILKELVAAGVPTARAKIWIQRIVKADKETRTAVERDLTKSEIVKGVKEGILGPDDAIEMLVDMGYSHDEAEYILMVNLASITGSPKTWSEFQDLVNLRRKAQGLPVKEIPKEIMDIEKKIMELQELRKTAEVENKDKKELAKIDKELEILIKQHQDLRKTG